jgi:hypothetical protein
MSRAMVTNRCIFFVPDSCMVACVSGGELANCDGAGRWQATEETKSRNQNRVCNYNWPTLSVPGTGAEEPCRSHAYAAFVPSPPCNSYLEAPAHHFSTSPRAVRGAEDSEESDD